MPSKAEASPTSVGATSFDAIGVPWRIGTGSRETPLESLGAPLATDDLAAVLDRIERFDRDWSRFRDDSLVARIAREPGSWRLPADAAYRLRSTGDALPAPSWADSISSLEPGARIAATQIAGD